jgi:hypothetical protein
MDEKFVLEMMRKAGGGWFPLASGWRLENNQRTNRACIRLAEQGLVKCVKGDPAGQFVCDWRLTLAGVDASYA